MGFILGILTGAALMVLGAFLASILPPRAVRAAAKVTKRLRCGCTHHYAYHEDGRSCSYRTAWLGSGPSAVGVSCNCKEYTGPYPAGWMPNRAVRDSHE